MIKKNGIGTHVRKFLNGKSSLRPLLPLERPNGWAGEEWPAAQLRWEEENEPQVRFLRSGSTS